MSGQGGAIDAGPLDQLGLGQTLLMGKRREYDELAWCKPCPMGFVGEDIRGPLTGAAQQMGRRAIEGIADL